jgi:hypothetical protein
LLRFQQVQYNVNLPVDMRFLEGQVLFGWNIRAFLYLPQW